MSEAPNTLPGLKSLLRSSVRLLCSTPYKSEMTVSFELGTMSLVSMVHSIRPSAVAGTIEVVHGAWR